MNTTKLFLFAAMMAATVANAQFNPCEYNLIGAGGAGVAAVDTSTATMPPRCTPCPTEGCVAWQMPADTAYHLSIFTTRPTNASIQLVSECNWLLWDTCAYISGDSVSPPMPLFLSLVIPANSQLIVCADLGDTIIIEVKATTPNGFPTYTAPILDLSTCNPPVSVTQPIPPMRHYWEFDGTYWREVSAMKPNGLYKVCGSRK